MPRFVVLLHETPPGYPRGRHYDLMLEQSGVLWTWALESLPQPGGEAVAAERLADHRLDYLEYEGKVSGGRGQVIRIDGGDFDSIPAGAGGLAVRLQGRIVRGVLILSPSSAAADLWQACLSSEQDMGEPPSTVRCLEPQEARGVAADVNKEFAELAGRYCELVEQHRSMDCPSFLREVHVLLPRLYTAALALPALAIFDDDELDDAWEDDQQDNSASYDVLSAARELAFHPDRGAHEEWDSLFRSLCELIGERNSYREVYDPYEPVSKGEVMTCLADDVADIYVDVRAGLRKWRRGEFDAALWEWRFDFESHWGAHTVDALRALYALASTYKEYKLGWPGSA